MGLVLSSTAVKDLADEMQSVLTQLLALPKVGKMAATLREALELLQTVLRNSGEVQTG